MRLLALSLLALLSSPPAHGAESRMQKLGRVLALEDGRRLGSPELDRYLRDSERSVRRRAALAAARLADPAAVPALVELLADREVEVRQMAAFALGVIGERGAAGPLAAALKDPEAVVRARAAEALGRLGDPARARDVAAMVLAAIPPGAPLVTIRGDDPGSASDPWIELRLGLFALARLKDAPAAELALLREGRPRFDWWAATWTAQRVASPGLRAYLQAAAGSDDPLSRAFAARGLGALKDASAVELLSRLTRDADENVVVNALRALAVLADTTAVPPVASALGSASPTVQVEALRALALLPPEPTLRSRVLPFVGHPLPWIRAAALPALARLDRGEFALVLSGLDPDPEWSVRAGLATALGEVGDEVSVSLLFGLLKDPDVRVLPAALKALRKARGEDAAETLRQHLSHPDFAVRAAAAEELVALATPGQATVLAAAYQRSLADTDLDARFAAVAGLAALKDESARAALQEVGRKDPARVVRERAAQALREQGGWTEPVGGEDAARPPLDYRKALEPHEPSPGRPVYTPRAILFTSRGRVELYLDVVETPLTTESFIALARRGFYNGLSFHRVVPGFVVQGGDPRGDGNGGPGYTLRCEIGQTPYGRGTVGMALSGKDTGGSQFFVALQPAPHLDGGHTAFGRVASGMDVVDQLRPGDVIERVEIWDGR
jgi:cyclophilin family peptidyl-prolyl cis-trans isomerase/HEAT repeat protein